MDKKKYVIVTPYFPSPDRWRGAFCFDFTRALIRSGKYDVRVFVPGRGGDYDYNGVHVYRFTYLSLPGGILPFLFSGINRIFFRRKISKCGINIKEIKVAHSHEIHCLTLALALKEKNEEITLVHHFHAMGHPFHISMPKLGIVPIYSTLLYLYYRRQLEKIDMPVFVSKRQRDMFGKWYPHGFLAEAEDLRECLTFGRHLRAVHLKPSYVLYNGIDYTVFHHDDGKKARSNCFVVGDVANFCESKDQITLIKAVERLCQQKGVFQGIKCILVGSGETLGICQEYVETKGMSEIVEFRTEMDHLDLPNFYRLLDLFVSPSWAEGFCCTFVEAHGCGVPIIGCKGVSVDECFAKEDQDKWLFEPQNDKKLAEIIKWFYNTREEQKFVDDFDIDKLVRGFIKQIEERA